MNQEHKSGGRNAKTERESRASSIVQLRNQKRSDMLQKKRTASITRGPTAYNIGEMAEKINSNDIKQVIEGVTSFRRLLSAEKNPPIDSIVMNGLTPIFVKYTNPENPIYYTIEESDKIRLIHESAWVITNIASGSKAQTEAVIKAGAVRELVKLLQVSSVDLQDQSIWALGNIAGDCEAARDAVIREGGVDLITRIVVKLLSEGKGSISVLRNAAWAMSNLNRGRSPPPDLAQMEKSLHVVLKLMQVEDSEIMVDTYWALSYMCDAGEKQVDMVIASGAIEALLKRLATYQGIGERGGASFIPMKEELVTPIIRTIGNIATYEDRHTDYIIKLGALSLLKNVFLFGVDNKKIAKIKKEICWVVSNIAAGTPDQVDSVIREGFLELLVSALKNSDSLTKAEACWALCNASMHGKTHKNHAREIAKAGVIAAFGKFLPTVRNEPKIIIIILDCLLCLLECGREDSLGGENAIVFEIEDAMLLDQIEELQESDNHGVVSRAEMILSEYFYGG